MAQALGIVIVAGSLVLAALLARSLLAIAHNAGQLLHQRVEGQKLVNEGLRRRLAGRTLKASVDA